MATMRKEGGGSVRINNLNDEQLPVFLGVQQQSCIKLISKRVVLVKLKAPLIIIT